MAMDFCKKCKRILPSTKSNGKEYLICPKCKTRQECTSDGEMSITESFSKKKVGVGVAKKIDFSGDEFKCKKCGNDKCRVIDLGMMYGDEDWVYLLKCTQCDYAERIGEMA